MSDPFGHRPPHYSSLRRVGGDIFLGIAALLVLGALMVCVAALVDAHHADIEARSECINGAPAITVTATAWQSDQGEDHRLNADVRITVDGVERAKGAFSAPSYRFTVALPSTPGTHTVSAIAVAGWGTDGQYPTVGEPPTAQVTVVDACRTETVLPTTTRQVTVITPPVVTPPAEPVVVVPKFAG